MSTTTGLNNINILSKSDYDALTDKDTSQLYMTPIVGVVESYSDGTEWYRKYSDGWIEQGGRVSVAQDSGTTVTLHVPFSDTNYYANWISCSGSKSDGQGTRGADTLTTSTFRVYNGQDCTMLANWEAKGYWK